MENDAPIMGINGIVAKSCFLITSRFVRSEANDPREPPNIESVQWTLVPRGRCTYRVPKLALKYIDRVGQVIIDLLFRHRTQTVDVVCSDCFGLTFT